MRLTAVPVIVLASFLAGSSPAADFDCDDYRISSYPSEDETFCYDGAGEQKYEDWEDVGGERHVRNVDEFRSAVCSHLEGQQTTVVVLSNINLTGELKINLLPGLTLKGTRQGTNTGAEISNTEPWIPHLFEINKGGVRISKLRFRGPSSRKEIIRPPALRRQEFIKKYGYCDTCDEYNQPWAPHYYAALADWRQCHARTTAFRINGRAFMEGNSITIENSEFHSWTGAGVEVRGLWGNSGYDLERYTDAADRDWCARFEGEVDADGVTTDLKCRTGGIIDHEDASRVLISRNYFHRNRQQGSGYGVIMSKGAYARIEKNTFWDNRHAVAADGLIGTGYFANLNLVLPAQTKYCDKNVLKYCWYEHHFDMHGRNADGSQPGDDDSSYNGGIGGEYVELANNTILGDQVNRAGRWKVPFAKRVRAVYDLRGVPVYKSQIFGNVIEHSGPGDAFRYFDDDQPLSYAISWSANTWDYAKPYDEDRRAWANNGTILDFDGDGIGDEIWTTGAAWYYRSGIFEDNATEWRFLNHTAYKLDELVLKDYDNNGLTDALREDENGLVWVSHNSSGPWFPLDQPDPRCIGAEPFTFCGDEDVAAYCRQTIGTHQVDLCMTRDMARPTQCSSSEHCGQTGSRCVLNPEAEKGDLPGICHLIYGLPVVD